MQDPVDDTRFLHPFEEHATSCSAVFVSSRKAFTASHVTISFLKHTDIICNCFVPIHPEVFSKKLSVPEISSRPYAGCPKKNQMHLMF